MSLHRGQLVADSTMELESIRPKAGPDCRFDINFARALLTGADGRIVIPLPFSANSERNDFSIYPLIGKRIRSLLLRSSVVPLAMVADGADGFIRFAPMDDTIDDSGQENLLRLIKALNDHPLLGLEILSSGPFIEITPPAGQKAVPDRLDLGKSRAIRVMQFIVSQGINESRLRFQENGQGFDEEILDRPVDRVDLNLFAIKDGTVDGKSDQGLSELPPISGE